jgi:acyl-CoA synthetase (AMP-forming)/AMP-acid ligase II
VISRPHDLVTSSARRTQYRESGYWDDSQLGLQLRKHAEQTPRKTAVVDLDGKRECTYAELDHLVNQAAQLLLSLDARPGEVISVQLPNWLEGVIIGLAVLRIGAVLNPLLPSYGSHELLRMMDVGHVRVLVTPDEYRGVNHAQVGRTLLEAAESFEHHLVIPNPAIHGDGTWFDELSRYSAASPDVELHAQDVNLLVFTSGTEATPKAVLHSEETLNCDVREGRKWLAMSDQEVVWMPAPIGHMTGIGRGVRMALFHGYTLVLQDRWDPLKAAQLIEQYRCSFTTAAATFLRDLVYLESVRSCDLSSMHLFASGGAPVPAELVTAAEQLGVMVLRQYGSTELKVVSAIRPTSPVNQRVSTDGEVLPHVELEVRNSAGCSIVGTPGEIFARGPASCLGFYGDEERTAATISTDGWIRSGDVGVLDQDGFLAIVGRTKEIIIRGGINIAPRELEDLIIEHPSVRQVAVVGVPDVRLGERTCACVVVKPGSRLNLDDLVDHLSTAGLAKFKLPQQLLIVDSFPMTQSGKVRKAELVELLVKSANDGNDP